MNTIRVKKLSPNAILPTYGSIEAAGADLYACCEDTVIEAHSRKLIPTGIAIECDRCDVVSLICARSGLASKRGLAPANKVGVIDSDYRGEIMVALHNHGTSAQTVERGERIAQLVIAPYFTADFCEVEELSDTARGEGGFGSTGRK